MPSAFRAKHTNEYTLLTKKLEAVKGTSVCTNRIVAYDKNITESRRNAE